MLSNAGLPELNPLMELEDDPAEDDFQKMLNDWENHIDTLKVIYGYYSHKHDIINAMNDGYLIFNRHHLFIINRQTNPVSTTIFPIWALRERKAKIFFLGSSILDLPT